MSLQPISFAFSLVFGVTLQAFAADVSCEPDLKGPSPAVIEVLAATPAEEPLRIRRDVARRFRQDATLIKKLSGDEAFVRVRNYQISANARSEFELMDVLRAKVLAAMEKKLQAFRSIEDYEDVQQDAYLKASVFIKEMINDREGQILQRTDWSKTLQALHVRLADMMNRQARLAVTQLDPLEMDLARIKADPGYADLVAEHYFTEGLRSVDVEKLINDEALRPYVAGLLRRLRPRLERIIRQRYYLNLDFAETADVNSVSRNRVHDLLNEGLRKMRYLHEADVARNRSKPKIADLIDVDGQIFDSEWRRRYQRAQEKLGPQFDALKMEAEMAKHVEAMRQSRAKLQAAKAAVAAQALDEAPAWEPSGYRPGVDLEWGVVTLEKSADMWYLEEDIVVLREIRTSLIQGSKDSEGLAKNVAVLDRQIAAKIKDYYAAEAYWKSRVAAFQANSGAEYEGPM